MTRISPLAAKIRLQMSLLNIPTIAELERRADVFAKQDGGKFPPDTLRNVMNGRTQEPRASRLGYLAQALKMSPEELLGSRADSMTDEVEHGPALRIPLKHLHRYFKLRDSDARYYVQPDSDMSPDLSEGEVCLIDAQDVTPKSNSLYLIYFKKDIELIRLLRRNIAGNFFYSSPGLDEEKLPQKAKVIGRVSGILRDFESMRS